MRPVSVFAKGPGSDIEQLRGDLHGRWRQATRAAMVLLSLHGLAPAQIAGLLVLIPAGGSRAQHILKRDHDVSQMTAAELERARRELAASLTLARPDSPARVPILARLSAIDTALATPPADRPEQSPGSPLP
jgi:hypothetical protein